MSRAIVSISRNRIKAGKLEDFKQFFRQGTPGIEADKPGTVAFLAYLNDEGSEVSIVHVFPDAAAMDRHLEGAAERARAAYEFMQPISMEVYGTPSDGVLGMMKQIAGTGVTVSIRPHHLGGVHPPQRRLMGAQPPGYQPIRSRRDVMCAT